MATLARGITSLSVGPTYEHGNKLYEGSKKKGQLILTLFYVNRLCRAGWRNDRQEVLVIVAADTVVFTGARRVGVDIADG